jgi:hypothetical protein
MWVFTRIQLRRQNSRQFQPITRTAQVNLGSLRGKYAGAVRSSIRQVLSLLTFDSLQNFEIIFRVG